MPSKRHVIPSAGMWTLSLLVLLAIAAFSLPATAQLYDATNLTSDIANVGTYHDANLVNPWGVSYTPTGPWWVSDNGTGLSTVYLGTGNPTATVVTIPTASGSGTGTPTGQVYNSTTGFQISGHAATFIFCTEDGTVSGWNFSVNQTQAVIAVNNSGNAVYKGMAIGAVSGANYLYVANFYTGNVDVFDSNFASHSFGSGSFVDSQLPSGYAPFNVANIGGKIYVAYAKQDAQKHDEVAGQGNGYVTVFDMSGNLLLRFAHILYLNAPWGMAVAPSMGFGGLGGDIIVGNFGSGAMVAYNPTTGKLVAPILDASGFAMRIDGLWALQFGNGGSGGPTTTLYYTAGNFGEAHGTFGTIKPHQGF